MGDVVENYHFSLRDSSFRIAFTIAEVQTPKCLAISAAGIPTHDSNDTIRLLWTRKLSSAIPPLHGEESQGHPIWLEEASHPSITNR